MMLTGCPDNKPKELTLEDAMGRYEGTLSVDALVEGLDGAEHFVFDADATVRDGSEWFSNTAAPAMALDYSCQSLSIGRVPFSWAIFCGEVTILEHTIRDAYDLQTRMGMVHVEYRKYSSGPVVKGPVPVEIKGGNLRMAYDDTVRGWKADDGGTYTVIVRHEFRGTKVN